MNKPTKLLFEHITCCRCGGTGMFGPLCVHAGICFKCSGKGSVLTKRGAVAQAFLNDLLRVTLDQLKVGDKIFFEGFNAGSYCEPSRWGTIESIEFLPNAPSYPGHPDKVEWRVNTTAGSWQGLLDDNGKCEQKFRKAWTAEEKQVKREIALAFQATLTKQGKPRKEFVLESI